MRSIRRELSVRLLAGVFLLLTAAGIVLGIFMHTRLLAAFDHTLETKARALASLTSLEGRWLEFDFSEEHLPEFSDDEEPEYFELRLRDGRAIARSASLGEKELPVAPTTSDVATFSNLRLPDGRKGRVVHLAIEPRRELMEPAEDGEDEIAVRLAAGASAPRVAVIVAVARGRGEMDALLYSLYGTLAGIDVVVLLGIVLLVRHAIDRGLAPIAAMNAQIAGIGPDQLDRRLQLPTPPAELDAVLQRVNGLLERLESGFERERRFASNVAHELRTPVAELRTACEVGALWPDDVETARQLFRDVHEIALQMEAVVTNLLTLSRCENGIEAVVRAPVLLHSVVRTCCARASNVEGKHAGRIETQVDPDLTVVTDADKLGMIVRNLIDNAVTYGAPSGVVRCSTVATPSGIELVIENEVEDVTRDDLQHVLEPFWRKDHVRSAGDHAGLGLSIVKALCDRLGIGLRVELDGGRTFTVRLSFAAMLAPVVELNRGG